MGEVSNRAAEEVERTWFKHRCVLLRGAGTSPYGDDLGVEEVKFSGFVRQRVHREVTTGGELTVTDTTVSCPLGLEVEVGDQIRLPQPFRGTWEVVARAANEGAGNLTPDHQKLWLQIDGTTTPHPEDDEPQAEPTVPASPYD